MRLRRRRDDLTALRDTVKALRRDLDAVIEYQTEDADADLDRRVTALEEWRRTVLAEGVPEKAAKGGTG